MSEGEAPAVLSQCVTHTDEVVRKLGATVQTQLADNADAVFGEHTCFFLTGSGGRGEMTEGSDIDGYVIRVEGTLSTGHDQLLLAATSSALADLELPPLDRDGAFLAMKSASDLVDNLGSTDDDATNAFTTRMLFLLESRPLVGSVAYNELFSTVRDAYRSTAPQHKSDFLPFFMVNDIIRYWRTVLLNHEDKLREKAKELEADGLSHSVLQDNLLAHRRYRSQKLRFPRCLSCFSTLAYFLALAPNDNDAITADQEREMFDLTPIARLQRVAEIQPSAEDRVRGMVELYAGYLTRTSSPKNEVLKRLQEDAAFQDATSEEGKRFAEEMFHLIQELGRGNRLHRQMLI